MRIGDIAGYVGNELASQMDRLKMSFKDFPFYIHCRGCGQYHEDKFMLYWTTKKEHFGNPDRSDVVSQLYCEVIGLHDKTVLLKAKAFKHRRYLGQVDPRPYSEDRDWYKQEWREDYFIVEASASALWTIMEAHANLEATVEKVMTA